LAKAMSDKSNALHKTHTST